MKNLKNIAIVLLFALFPVLMLIATQTTTASQIEDTRGRVKARQMASIKMSVDNMLKSTRNLKRYQMKKVELE